MVRDTILERYLDALLRGDRKSCCAVIEETLQCGIPANSVYADIIWPIMVDIGLLLRSDKITPVQEHLATRINRTIVDQLQNKLPNRPRRNKKVVICCAPTELEELGAQILANLFDCDGWQVRLLGGGLNNDDILAFINEYAPDMLLIYGTAPKQAPQVRQMIGTIRSVNAWPNMRIMLSGGVFNRAEGLWQEVGADLFAETAVDALRVALQETAVLPQPPAQASRRKKRHRATKPQPLQVA